jgi:hypothetical protein
MDWLQRSMLHRVLLLVFDSWAIAAPVAPASAAGTVFPRGSRIGLEPPGELVVSHRFAGFEDRTNGVILTLLDLPEPAYQALEKSAFGGTVKDLTIDTREVFPFREGIGYLITGHQETEGTLFRSWYLLVNTTTREAGHIAALIAVRLPNSATRIYPDRTIREALATVSFRTPPTNELLGLLPFKLTDLAGFRLAKIAPQGLAVLMDGPGDDLTKQPYMIVAVGRGAPAPTDLRPKFAQDLMRRLPLSELAINSGEAMRIGGRPGYELRASAKDAHGNPIAVVQWLRYGGGGVFLRTVGVVSKDDWERLFPRFRAVRDGIQAR